MDKKSQMLIGEIVSNQLISFVLSNTVKESNTIVSANTLYWHLE